MRGIWGGDHALQSGGSRIVRVHNCTRYPWILGELTLPRCGAYIPRWMVEDIQLDTMSILHFAWAILRTAPEDNPIFVRRLNLPVREGSYVLNIHLLWTLAMQMGLVT